MHFFVNTYVNNISDKTVTVIGVPETHFQLIRLALIVSLVKTKISFFIPQSSL